ncbi:MAG: hypothetical protein Q4D42_10105, partial [Eubacteriales bacterium]|nr:hypothetical protein [Eubacteriales bacterium]
MRNFSKRMFSVSLTCSLFVLSFCFLTGCSSNTTASNGSSPLGSAPDDASSETIAQNISGCLPELSKEDLIAQSTLIATGTVTEVSDAFQIAPVGGGDPSVFTDYFFTVSDVLRGEPDDNVVSVRIQGGTANGMSSTAELEPQLEVGKSYLLFLYQPNMGGSYNTKGDYDSVTGLYRGAYELDTSTAAP